MRKELYHILVFVFVVFLQVFIFNNIEIAGLINPYIYIYAILILPVKFNQLVLLLLAFGLGGMMDLFSNTLGIHMFATTFSAFLRPYVLKLFTTQDDIDKPAPTMQYLGVSTFVRYITVIVFVHHVTLFLMEAFSFAGMHFILLKAFVSSFISILLILVVEKLFSK